MIQQDNQLQDFYYYNLGAQAILKALKRDVLKLSKDEILNTIDNLIDSFSDDLKNLKVLSNAKDNHQK